VAAVFGGGRARARGQLGVRVGRLRVPGLPAGVRRAFRFPFRTFAAIGRDVDEEVRLHLEMRAAELEAAGMSPEQARAEALRRFGDAEDLKAFCRQVERPGVIRSRARAWLADLAQDLRFAGRQLRRSPGFALAAAVTLALGIGANATIYSAVHPLLLAPLPYPGGDRIVNLWESVFRGRVSVPPSPTVLDAWRARARTVEAIATYNPGQWTLSAPGEAELVSGDYIGPELAAFLGASPLLGRAFTPEDACPGAAPVVLLSEGLWRRRFGGRSDVTGHAIMLDGRSYTVVGVMPRDFGRWILGDMDKRQVFVPLVPLPAVQSITAIGRLRPGVTTEQATQELSAIAAAPEGKLRSGFGAKLQRVRAFETESYATTLELLFGAVGLVLLVACANVASLLLVRAWSRQREFGIRTAMGAGRSRLVRQLVTESVALSLAAGALGALLAWRAIPLVAALRPPLMGFLGDIRMDLAVLAWTLGLAIVTGIVFGLAPALFATEHGVSETLKDSSRTMAGQAGSRRFRASLIVGEIALSAVLLIGAGLLIRSLVARIEADETLYPSGLMTVDVELPASDASEASRAAEFSQIVERARGGPGVQVATLALVSPWRAAIRVGPLDIEGRASPPGQQAIMLGYNQVQPDFFRAVGIQLLAGRLFASEPALSARRAPSEVVVSQSFGRHFFPAGDAVGARLRMSGAPGYQTVVGVVGDARFPGHSGGPAAETVYEPVSGISSAATVVLRGDRPSAVLPFVTQSILSMDPTIRLRNAESMDRALERARAEPRFIAALLAAFAALALVLAAVGLYGVVAYSVSRRTHEIGVRVALGAGAENVLTLVLRRSLALACAGIAIGLAGAAAVTRLLRSQLYGIEPLDPATFAAVAILLGLVALLASYLPARAALRVDPVEALRVEG
jgi:putative ABC transport system permease protein